MPNTFTKIASVTVGSGGAATMDFTAIPATYTDLKVVISARKNTTGVDAMSLAINGGATAISSNKYIDSGAGTLRSGSAVLYQGLIQPSDYTADTFSSTEIYIPNYTISNYKSISSDTVIENNATASYAGFTASLWSSNSSITSLAFSTASANFVEFSTATLYGIKNS